MSSKFNVGLDDILEDESGGRTGARWLATALGVIFFTLSSITTYLFFSTYAPALGACPVINLWLWCKGLT